MPDEKTTAKQGGLETTDGGKTTEQHITKMLKEKGVRVDSKVSDSRTVPPSNPNSGYIKGYEEINKNEEKLIAEGIDVQQRTVGENTYNTVRNQSTPSYDMDKFKYGLESSDTFYDYEDPTYLGFELYIDDMSKSSPFYIPPSNQAVIIANKVYRFLNKYRDIEDVRKRIELYSEFEKRFFEIFNRLSEPQEDKPINNNYYITNISGLDVLNKKIVNYPEDRINITLNEDVSMTALYLSELYNNLVYSYRNNRYIIPDNLMRFDLHIKITDIRKFRKINPDFDPSLLISKTNNPYVLDDKKSTMVYVLHDCNFDFFNSKNVGDEMTVGGFNVSTPDVSNLTFGVYFKSISKRLEPTLKKSNINLYNKMIKLYDKGEESQENDQVYFKQLKNGEDLADWNMQSTYKYFPNGTEKEYSNSPLDYRKEGFDFTGRAKQLGDDVKRTIKSKIKEKRNDLINRMVSRVEEFIGEETGLGRKTPEGNVYDTDYRKKIRSSVDSLSVESLKSAIKNDLSGNVKESITEGKNAIVGTITNFDKKINF